MSQLRMTDAGQEEFSLRSIAVAAYAPATLFGLSEGAMLPVIAASTIARGGNESTAALIAAMLGIGSIITNIPSGIIATRLGERKAMLIAAIGTVIALVFCLIDLGRGTGSLLLYGTGVFLIGCSSSVFTLARQSYLTEVTPPHMRARALSTLGGTMRIGLFIGPFLAAGAMAIWGLSGAYYISLAAISVAVVIISRVPDLEVTEEQKQAALEVTTMSVLKRDWRMFITLGIGILLLNMIRQTRQVVIPLWAAHIGLSPSTSSLIYGLAGGVDMLMFYPSGKVMDTHGRRAVAIPCVVVMGISFVLMPLTHGAITLALVAMVMGIGNGCGSGIVMTLGADVSPTVGRPTFLAIWRELADGGQSLGPLLLSALTAAISLGVGIAVSGGVGFLAAGALWLWIPKRSRGGRREREAAFEHEMASEQGAGPERETTSERRAGAEREVVSKATE